MRIRILKSVLVSLLIFAMAANSFGVTVFAKEITDLLQFDRFVLESSDSQIEPEDFNYESDEDTDLTLSGDKIPLSSVKSDSYAGGDGSEQSPYEISNTGQLSRLLSDHGHVYNRYYKLTSDIDLTGYIWDSEISSCYFDGNNHTISNFSISTDMFFSNQGYIKNLKLKNISEKGTAPNDSTCHEGHMVGNNRGTISGVLIENVYMESDLPTDVSAYFTAINEGTVMNCTLSGTVNSASGKFAGIVGYNQAGGIVQDCINCAGEINMINAGTTYYLGEGGIVLYNSGTVKNCELKASINIGESGRRSIGGIVFENHEGGVIENCSTSSDVKLKGENKIGGIVCTNEGTILNCDNNASIEGPQYAGGITAVDKGGIIKECSNHGDIKGTYSAAGITGDCSYLSMQGDRLTNISECINEGDIDGLTGSAGGIAGISLNGNEINISIDKCENKGIVKGKDKVGGIIANAEGNIRLTECMNYGRIIEGQYAGGIVGYGKSSKKSNENITIIKCANVGDFNNEAMSPKIGGIAGFIKNGVIEESCSVAEINESIEANVNGYAYIGGIAGNIDEDFTVSDCFAMVSGEIDGRGTSGGLFGQIGSVNDTFDQSIDQCYSVCELKSGIISDGNKNRHGGFAGSIISETSVLAVADTYILDNGDPIVAYPQKYSNKNITKKTDAQMKNQSTFKNFDFSGKWIMGNNGYFYPVLKWFPDVKLKGGDPDPTPSIPEIDYWGFPNKAEFFGEKSNRYMIKDRDLARLTETIDSELLKEWISVFSEFKKTKKEIKYHTKIDLFHPSEWNGSCEGMSRTVVLKNEKSYNYSTEKFNLETEEQTLYSVKAADIEYYTAYSEKKEAITDSIGAAESVINFYHLQQYFPNVQYAYICMMNAKTEGIPKKDRKQYKDICRMGYELKNNPNKMGIISFQYEGGNNNVSSHTVAAYGYVDYTGDKVPDILSGLSYAEKLEFRSKYNHCILIYDPINPGCMKKNREISDVNLYYNDEGDWIIIPYISSDNVDGDGDGCELKIVTTDEDYINTVDFLTGKYAFSYRNIDFKIFKSMKDVLISTNGSGWCIVDNNKLSGDTTGYTLITSNGDGNGNNTIALPNSEKYYFRSGEKGLDATIYMGDHLVEVASDVPGNAVVGTAGAGEVKLTLSGNVFVGLTANDRHRALNEPNVYVVGEGVTQLSANQVAEGVQIESDELSNVTIYAEDSDGKGKLIEVDTKAYKLRLIDNNGKLEAVADEDGDGKFETVCGTEQPIDEDETQEGLWVSAKDLEGITYSGAAMKPEVHVYDSDKLLKQNIDYTISYKNNKNAYTLSENDAGFDPKKAPTITITGKGNYDSKETVYFKILKQDINGADFSADDITLAATDKKQKIVSALYWNGKALKNKTDYKYEIYKSSDTAFASPLGDSVTGKGDYVVRLTGNGNFTGVRNINLTLTSDYTLVSKLKIGKIPAMAYTGTALKPEPTVNDGNTALTKDEHYTLSYASNINPGTGYVIIKGIPEKGYAGSKRIAFKITAPKSSGTSVYDIGEAKDTEHRISITCDGSVEFMKGGAKPAVTVAFKNADSSETTLIEGLDYKLTYKYNASFGGKKKPVAVVTGTGKYKGKRECAFTIIEKNLNKVTLLADDVPYKNKANSYVTKITLIDEDGKELKSGRDYDKIFEYSYTKDTNVTANGSTVTRHKGDPVDKSDIIPVDTVISVTVKAKAGSGYSNKAGTTYKIIEKSIASAKISIPDQVYTGKPIILNKKDVSVSIKGQKLNDTDYEIVSYTNNTQKGTAKVTIRGVGNYGGLKTQTFKIKAKGFKWWWRK